MEARKQIHKPERFAHKLADMVVNYMGSWTFIIVQSAIVAFWIIYNIISSRPYDIYPFILLNLVFSTQAAYASPLILMSQNRASERDRKRDDIEAHEVDELYASHKLLLTINNQQLEILELLKDK